MFKLEDIHKKDLLYWDAEIQKLSVFRHDTYTNQLVTIPKQLLRILLSVEQSGRVAARRELKEELESIFRNISE